MLVEIQDVYDVISEYYHHRTDLQHKALEDALSRVPPARSVADEWCHDCKEFDAERHYCPRWNKVIRQTVKDIKAKSCWISCSERLPEDEYVLISKKPTKILGDKWSVAIAIRTADPRSGKIEWRDSGFGVIQDDKVLAWMPLPEPYKESEQNET